MPKQVGGGHLSQTREVLDQLGRGLYADPLVIPNIDLAVGASVCLPHGLGRVPRGYHILRKSAPAEIYEDYTHTQREHSLLLVNAGAVAVSFDVAILR